jgi:hypothetical protein
MHRAKKNVEELEAIGLQRLRMRPGCRGVSGLTLTLDDDGEWSLVPYGLGSSDGDLIRRAALAVSHQMHDEFDLIADT